MHRLSLREVGQAPCLYLRNQDSALIFIHFQGLTVCSSESTNRSKRVVLRIAWAPRHDLAFDPFILVDRSNLEMTLLSVFPYCIQTEELFLLYCMSYSLINWSHGGACGRVYLGGSG